MGSYLLVWTLDRDASDDVCPDIEPTRIEGESDDSCDEGCACSTAAATMDERCVVIIGDECDDQAVACALAFEDGATTLRGGCDIEVYDDDGSVLAQCRYAVIATSE